MKRVGRRDIALTISPMTLDDIPGVMEIETRSFPTPWSESSFRYELLENPYASLFVVRRRDPATVIAFACVWVVDQEIKVNNIAVHPDWRCRGVGRRLLQHLIDFGRNQGCREMTLEVRPSNEAGLALYGGAGFARIGRRKQYYTDTHEDAIIMGLPIDPGADE